MKDLRSGLKNFTKIIKLVCFAIVIAVPLAWLASNKWLQNLGVLALVIFV